MTKKPYILAIDGRAAAGKTTLAEKIATRFQASVIHMDDFFLPPVLRTEERYNQPGGNVHYERFLEEIVQPLQNGTLREYRRFSCGKMEYEDILVKLAYQEFYIVEGAYSTHPVFGKYYDAALFADITRAEQKKRILDRNGAEGWKMFEQRWIPLEEKYFEEYDIAENCDYEISTKVAI